MLKQRTNELYGSPPVTKSEVVQISIDGKWGQDGAICIRQDQPLPSTILGFGIGDSRWGIKDGE
jgi:hypothetical protein